MTAFKFEGKEIKEIKSMKEGEKFKINGAGWSATFEVMGNYSHLPLIAMTEKSGNTPINSMTKDYIVETVTGNGASALELIAPMKGNTLSSMFLEAEGI